MGTPKYMDIVRSKLNETIGVVIAVYTDEKEVLRFDIRTNEDRVYYGTPAENWTTVSKEEDAW